MRLASATIAARGQIAGIYLVAGFSIAFPITRFAQ
jgi:hypothetical protein